LKPKGCGSGTYTGHLKLTVVPTRTFGIQAVQNVDAGYDEVLCIECKNTAGSITKKDNWRVQQMINCATALKYNAYPNYDSIHPYEDKTDYLVIATDWQEFFNLHETYGHCPSAADVKCSLQHQGCTTAYLGLLTIDASTGEVKAP